MENAILIFAPHPDDEVLGCGGTITKRIRQGYEAYIVFMTDGAHSHIQISAKRMKQIRRKEAVIANSVLGVPTKNLFFLGFEDGCLKENRIAAQSRVKDVKYQYLIWPFKGFRPKLLPLIIKGFFIHRVKEKTKLVQINISDFLDLKKEALFSYKSQTGSFEGADPPLPASFVQGSLKEYEEFYACR